MRITLAVLALMSSTQANNFLTKEIEKFEQWEESAEPTTPCCNRCDEPQEKYYSVDKAHGMCGEACMLPKHFWIFKIFEPSLAKDETTNSPCAVRKYTIYKETPTHGVWPVTMTLDLYAPSQDDAALEQEEDVQVVKMDTIAVEEQDIVSVEQE